MAIHFAGPTWQALDGSLVVGNAAKATHFPAPDQDGVDWLFDSCSIARLSVRVLGLL